MGSRCVSWRRISSAKPALDTVDRGQVTGKKRFISVALQPHNRSRHCPSRSTDVIESQSGSCIFNGYMRPPPMCPEGLSETTTGVACLSTVPLVSTSHPVPICPSLCNPRTATMTSGDARSHCHHSEADGKTSNSQAACGACLTTSKGEQQEQLKSPSACEGIYRELIGSGPVNFVHLIFHLVSCRFYCSSECQSVD